MSDLFITEGGRLCVKVESVGYAPVTGFVDDDDEVPCYIVDGVRLWSGETWNGGYRA